MAETLIREVIIKTKVRGFHKWETAPDFCAFLRRRHFHYFHIECRARVSHNNREIEFITFEPVIQRYLLEKYGDPCEFGNMSCEDIAQELLEKFELQSCEVTEDGNGGAIVRR